jgi:carbamate kinase
VRVVVALGGNALLKRGESMTAEAQRQNVRLAAPALAAVASQHTLVLSHGNGPQVGLLALQAAAYTEVEAYPLDVLGAETMGMIGYVIEQELGNVMPKDTPLASLLTMIEVDPADPAFNDPSKFVGPVYTKDRRMRWLPPRRGTSSRTATPGGASSRLRGRSASSRPGPSAGCSTRAWS